ncbi:MAG: ABC transporter substrate-binding protein [Bacteroidota bacterium]
MRVASKKSFFAGCRRFILRPLSTTFFASLAIVCLLVGAMSSCSNPKTQTAEQSPAFVSDDASEKDYFPDKVEIKHAKGFTVSYFKHYKVVQVINPFEKTADTARYILVQRGMPKPTHYPGAQVIEVPIRTMIGGSSAHIALTDFLQSNQVLIGLGSFDYISSPEVLKMIEEKKLTEVGNGQSINQEIVLSLAPDLLMMIGRTDSKFTANPLLTAAGIGVVTNSEWQENTPLGRAEWVKLMAVFLNKEALVNQKFAEVERKYQEMAQLTKNVSHRPKVFNGMAFKGTWHVAGGKGYMSVFLKDAGAVHPWVTDSSTGSLQLDFESVYAVAMDADFWINPSNAKTTQDILTNDSRNADFKAFKTGKVFNNNKRLNERGSNDYWESGMVSPHIVLADLIKIFHPELLPQHELVYYRQVTP